MPSLHAPASHSRAILVLLGILIVIGASVWWLLARPAMSRPPVEVPSSRTSSAAHAKQVPTGYSESVRDRAVVVGPNRRHPEGDSSASAAPAPTPQSLQAASLLEGYCRNPDLATMRAAQQAAREVMASADGRGWMLEFLQGADKGALLQLSLCTLWHCAGDPCIRGDYTGIAALPVWLQDAIVEILADESDLDRAGGAFMFFAFERPSDVNAQVVLGAAARLVTCAEGGDPNVFGPAAGILAQYGDPLDPHQSSAFAELARLATTPGDRFGMQALQQVASRGPEISGDVVLLSLDSLDPGIRQLTLSELANYYTSRTGIPSQDVNFDAAVVAGIIAKTLPSAELREKADWKDLLLRTVGAMTDVQLKTEVLSRWSEQASSPNEASYLREAVSRLTSGTEGQHEPPPWRSGGRK